jgi:hypothetical protein
MLQIKREAFFLLIRSKNYNVQLESGEAGFPGVHNKKKISKRSLCAPSIVQAGGPFVWERGGGESCTQESFKR